MKPNRQFYRPAEAYKGSLETVEDLPGTEIWRYEREAPESTWERTGKTRYLVMIFGGKRSAPDYHYGFNTEEKREEFIQDRITIERRHLARRKEEAAERKAKIGKDRPPVGSFLVCSWGYDQTNIDYYQVTAHIGKTMVEIQEVGSVVVRSDTGANYVKPSAGGNGKKLKKAWNGNSVRIASYASAYPWDGRERYETAPGWGH